MKDKGFRCVVGARGWQHDAWDGSYYPEDLPPEWRLAYYANEFTGTLIPATDWQDAPPAAWRNWYQDTPPEFRFVLEMAPAQPARPTPPTALLAEKFVGWVALTGPCDRPCLTAAALSDPAAEQADVVLCNAADMMDRRALGHRLTMLAGRDRPPVALITLEDVAPSSLHDLRLLAELTGLA